MNYSWSVWVIGFNAERQQALLKKWGFDKFELNTLLTILMTSITLAFMSIALAVLYRRPKNIDPVLQHYQRFRQRLTKAGIDCPAYEGPQQLAGRAIALLPQHAAAIREIISLYTTLRYGRAEVAQVTTLKRLVDRFRP